MIPFGAAFPGPDMVATKMLNRSLRNVLNRLPSHSVMYDLPEATDVFRRQIPRHSLSHGCNFSPEDLLATCGALEALNLCLRAVAKPEEIIAIESPTYFGVMEALHALSHVLQEQTSAKAASTGFDRLQYVERATRYVEIVIAQPHHGDHWIPKPKTQDRRPG
jgi:DNA-binding transcriptional MocR family regulator